MGNVLKHWPSAQNEFTMTGVESGTHFRDIILGAKYWLGATPIASDHPHSTQRHRHTSSYGSGQTPPPEAPSSFKCSRYRRVNAECTRNHENAHENAHDQTSVRYNEYHDNIAPRGGSTKIWRASERVRNKERARKESERHKER